MKRSESKSSKGKKVASKGKASTGRGEKKSGKSFGKDSGEKSSKFQTGSSAKKSYTVKKGADGFKSFDETEDRKKKKKPFGKSDDKTFTKDFKGKSTRYGKDESEDRGPSKRTSSRSDAKESSFKKTTAKRSGRYGSDSERASRTIKTEGDRPKRSFGRYEESNERPKKSFNRSGDYKERPKPVSETDESGEKPRRSSASDKKGTSKRGFVKSEPGARPKRSISKREQTFERSRRSAEGEEASDKPFKKSFRDKPADTRPFSKRERPVRDLTEKRGRPATKKAPAKRLSDDGLIRLNRYIANTGICSRREADELIAAGAVMVNGLVVTEMGYQVKPEDEVRYGGETIRKERMVYMVLNKPKDYITTTDDPQDRRTVMALIKDACKERVYPVGRLDRETTGVLMFTNDGELTKKLTHPRYEIKKIYHVELDKNFKLTDLKLMQEGVELEDGLVKPDLVEFVGEKKNEVGIELHSGKNRVVRRLFEQLGYNVIKLDRVFFAGLTKKDLPRGRWRFLSPMEVNYLKMQTGQKEK